MTRTRSLSPALEAFQHKPFRWLAFGRWSHYLGNAVAPIALAFAVLDLTGSTTDLGLVVGARSVTNVLLLLWGGVLADRLPRGLVLQGGAIAAAVTQAAVAALVLTGTATIPLLVVLACLNGAVAGVSMPAALSATPLTVPSPFLRQANALLRIGTNAAMVGGAAAGATLVAVVGPGWGIAADAASFAVASLCFARIGVAAPERTEERVSALADLRDGWSEFRSRQWVWAIVVMAMICNALFSGAVVVLGPAVADEAIGRAQWGLVTGSVTLGFVVGGFIALRWQPRHLLRVGTVLCTTGALPLLALGYAPILPVLVLAFLLNGIALEQFSVAWDVSMQENVPQDRLARVYSYDALGSFVAIPLGEVAAGPVSDSVGRTPTLGWAALICVVASLAPLLSPQVRSMTRARGEDRAEVEVDVPV